MLDNIITLSQTMMSKYPKLRRGQALFIATHSLLPNLAEQVRGTEHDPFFFDDRIDSFMNILSDALSNVQDDTEEKNS